MTVTRTDVRYSEIRQLPRYEQERCELKTLWTFYSDRGHLYAVMQWSLGSFSGSPITGWEPTTPKGWYLPFFFNSDNYPTPSSYFFNHQPWQKMDRRISQSWYIFVAFPDHPTRQSILILLPFQNWTAQKRSHWLIMDTVLFCSIKY